MKEKNYYTILFLTFLALGIIILAGPLIIYWPTAYNIVHLFLNKVGNYKEAYISILGATIGTGLAVSSALWLQRKDSIKKVDENLLNEKNTKRKSASIIYNWYSSEINMLWGMWIWTKFDMSIYIDVNKQINYEPYPVPTEGIFDSFLQIQDLMTTENIKTFFELYYLSEKLNNYIQCYNKTNYDIAYLSSLPIYSNGTSIQINTDLVKTTTSKEYKEILKFLINDNSNFLFLMKELIYLAQNYTYMINLH